MRWNERFRGEHHNGVLAEILLSDRVGTAHVRYVGDIISAEAQLSMGFLESGGLPLERWADLVEAVLELEDAYRRAWKAVVDDPESDQRAAKLQVLERALSDAATGICEIARENGIGIERISS